MDLLANLLAIATAGELREAVEAAIVTKVGKARSVKCL
jgi:hypothetical protein